MLYVAKTPTDTAKTKKMARRNEMRVLLAITRNTQKKDTKGMHGG